MTGIGKAKYSVNEEPQKTSFLQRIRDRMAKTFSSLEKQPNVVLKSWLKLPDDDVIHRTSDGPIPEEASPEGRPATGEASQNVDQLACGDPEPDKACPSGATSGSEAVPQADKANGAVKRKASSEDEGRSPDDIPSKSKKPQTE